MKDESTHCVFCKISRRDAPGRFVYEDETVVAFKDLHPQAPTHILVVPRKHIESLDVLTSEDKALIGHLHWVAAEVARQHGIHQAGYRTVINTGVLGGQTVFHLHVHLMGGRAMTWPPG
jgi:histidine triad (HIT) family protein